MVRIPLDGDSGSENAVRKRRRRAPARCGRLGVWLMEMLETPGEPSSSTAGVTRLVAPAERRVVVGAVVPWRLAGVGDPSLGRGSAGVGTTIQFGKKLFVHYQSEERIPELECAIR